MRKNLLLITPGDPQGIGPEVTWKALEKIGAKLQRRGFQLKVIGARSAFGRRAQGLESAGVEFVAAPESTSRPELHLGGYQSGWSIETAAQLLLQGKGSALVTGPISKEHLQAGGYHFNGHTDFLAHLAGRGDVTMMLANSFLRVSLVTVHNSLSSVPQKVSRESILRCIEHTIAGLQNYWGIKKPRIAIMAMNPHAGEGGIFGREDIDILSPAIQSAQVRFKNQASLSGPHPSDTWFALNHLRAPHQRADAAIAMYHDQGLIPVKLLDFQNTVNLSLGLPFLRTSVDHGTAFDIAGKNKADPSSMIAALELAARDSTQRDTTAQKRRVRS